MPPTTTSSTNATKRIQALEKQLQPGSTTNTKKQDMATAVLEKKPPITCHVLDTTLGRPAAEIPVTLTLHSGESLSGTAEVRFKGVTNGDVSILFIGVASGELLFYLGKLEKERGKGKS